MWVTKWIHKVYYGRAMLIINSNTKRPSEWLNSTKKIVNKVNGSFLEQQNGVESYSFDRWFYERCRPHTEFCKKLPRDHGSGWETWACKFLRSNTIRSITTTVSVGSQMNTQSDLQKSKLIINSNTKRPSEQHQERSTRANISLLESTEQGRKYKLGLTYQGKTS